MYMSKVVKKITFTVNRSNNGYFELPNPIQNIKWLHVSSIFFKHGPKKKIKKSKKKKRDDSDDDSDFPYENGNPDLINSNYISFLINDFESGTLYDIEGEEKEKYTMRICNVIDEDTGEGDWGDDDIFWDKVHHWDSKASELKTIKNINIKTSSDKDPNPVNINFEIELCLGIL